MRTALTARKIGSNVEVPWTGFDLINAFNTWKKTADAGTVFAVAADGTAEVMVTGLAWRAQVHQQVFEEAAVDLANGLKAWSDCRTGGRAGKRIGFPRYKKKSTVASSFRLRNKQSRGSKAAIRIGDNDRPRSVRLPGIGQIAVHDDTRRLRRMLIKGRARILFATVTLRGGRWWVSLNVEAAELHSARQHQPRYVDDSTGWVGVDRGLSAFLVAATSDGREVARIANAPKALAAGMKHQQRLAKSLSRKQKGSHNRKDAASRLGRHHARVANVRRHFLHQASNALVKTHDRLVIEDLNVSGMLRNHHLARAISDAGWSDFARMLTYKQAWRVGELVKADRWYASSRICSVCGERTNALTLADRIFVCDAGHRLDRDMNAAANLARWGQAHYKAPSDPRTPKQGVGQPKLADERALANTVVLVKPTRVKREPTFTSHPRR